MRRLTALFLLVGWCATGHAKSIVPVFGSAVDGVRIAMTAHGKETFFAQKKTTFTFYIHNQNKKPITIIERMTCSGLIGFFVLISKDGDKPYRRSFVNKQRCTRNGPVWRTIKPGQMIAVPIGFIPRNWTAGKYRILGLAHVRIKGRTASKLILRSPSLFWKHE